MWKLKNGTLLHIGGGTVGFNDSAFVTDGNNWMPTVSSKMNDSNTELDSIGRYFALVRRPHFVFLNLGLIVILHFLITHKSRLLK